MCMWFVNRRLCSVTVKPAFQLCLKKILVVVTDAYFFCLKGFLVVVLL